VLLSLRAGFAQPTRLGPSCDLSIVGAKETRSFLDFDRDLRAALSAADPASTALLVEFPLRVNTGHGSYSVNDPAILQARFQEAFSPAVRKAVLDQKTNDIFCNYTGVMYGNGAVWVELTKAGYAIQTINLASSESAGAGVDFVCRTEKHRILIDHIASADLRYRVWNRPRALAEKPDLEIAAGKKDVEGTGPCAHAIWTFTNGATTYSIDETGCAPSTEGVKGRLTVSTGGKQQAQWPCY